MRHKQNNFKHNQIASQRPTKQVIKQQNNKQPRKLTAQQPLNIKK